MKLSPYIEKKSWAAVENVIRQLDPEFVAAVEPLSLLDFNVYCIKYPYGTLIQKQGKFQIPIDKGCSVPIMESLLDPITIDDLNYSNFIPLGFITQQMGEVFLEIESRRTVMRMIPKGACFGVWSFLDSGLTNVISGLWNMSSGVNTLLHQKRGLINVSSDIKNKFKFQDTEVIFLGSEWLAHKKDPAWQNFLNFLAARVWHKGSFWRYQNTWEIIFFWLF